MCSRYTHFIPLPLSITGEMTVLYLFTRVRFNWNEVDFSLFSTYMMVTNLLGKRIYSYTIFFQTSNIISHRYSRTFIYVTIVRMDRSYSYSYIIYIKLYVSYTPPRVYLRVHSPFDDATATLQKRVSSSDNARRSTALYPLSAIRYPPSIRHLLGRYRYFSGVDGHVASRRVASV